MRAGAGVGTTDARIVESTVRKRQEHQRQNPGRTQPAQRRLQEITHGPSSNHLSVTPSSNDEHALARGGSQHSATDPGPNVAGRIRSGDHGLSFAYLEVP